MTPATAVKKTTSKSTTPESTALKAPELATIPGVEEIRALARAEAAEFAIFESVEDLSIPPHDAYYHALEAWLNGFDPNVISGAADAMETMRAQYRAMIAEETHNYPAFWLARDEAYEQVMRPRELYPPIPSPAELNASKVPHYQIAKIWRFLTPDGEPDFEAVERELADPGSVLTDEHRAKVHAAKLLDVGIGRAPVERDEQPTEQPEPEPNVPSIEELIRSRANVAQIASVKARQYRTEIEPWQRAVRIIAETIGVNLSASAQQTVNEGGASVKNDVTGQDGNQARLDKPVVMETGTQIFTKDNPDEQPPEILIEEDAEPLTLEDHVAHLFEQGNDATGIARALNISPKHVRNIIRKLQG